MSKIDVALIGAGRMGSIHGPNAGRHPGMRLKYVIDPRPEAAAAVGGPFGAAHVSLDEALADPAIGGVLVCSSTDLHLEHTLAAVEAGKAVFCEKPLDLDLGKVVAAAPKLAKARLVLAFNRRFDPHFVALKAKVDAGAVGRIESLHLINHDPASPPPGFIPTSGGLFKDFTIHDLDLARWLLGEEIAEVYAAASCLVDPEIGRLGDVDTARTVLKTHSGRLCVISNTRRSGYGYDQRIEAFGSSGMVSAGNVAVDMVHAQTEAGSSGAPIKYGFLQRYVEAYRAEMDHFADVLHGRAEPLVGYADGLAALALAEACDESVRTGDVVKPGDYTHA
ncbi:inositol 2-dehydrogenase [Brevundimonas lenta]|uniref:Myo-inositol 2-dehydrogenase/D-chiro-inositol 1-dehydrogenase n=1 Tax=Brevundimonas lenta TaxID=424796 RepID=A0A7W6JBC7_9CAUL|nr:myo-inositol 2-dehydrogenase/D-chiro-inositol 1-dehydrogenase [Brevundimonas lenta]